MQSPADRHYTLPRNTNRRPTTWRSARGTASAPQHDTSSGHETGLPQRTNCQGSSAPPNVQFGQPVNRSPPTPPPYRAINTQPSARAEESNIPANSDGPVFEVPTTPSQLRKEKVSRRQTHVYPSVDSSFTSTNSAVIVPTPSNNQPTKAK